MKIAVPVKDDTLDIFPNAGHTPFFGVFNVSGVGIFKQCKLEELRPNPRAEHECSGHHHEGECSHDHDDNEHRNEHKIMVELLRDCEVLLVKKACKNTKSVFEEAGIRVHAAKEGSKAGEIIASYIKGL